MDQDSTKGTDKRNWRERLGIGTTPTAATPDKPLPRIGDDFRKVTPAPAAPRVTPVKAPVKVTGTVKPAPMAPRPAPKATSVYRPTAPLPATDKLAERLQAQREASEKLADQRIQIARQKAEMALQPKLSPSPVAKPAPAPAPLPTLASKPKFTFAEEDAAPLPPIAQQRPAVAGPLPGSLQQPMQAQIPPARPPLGANTGGFQQSRAPQQFQPQAQQPITPPSYYPQQPPYGTNGNPNYQQGMPPNYRPIDPATGYPAQPQQYGAPPMQRPYGAPGGNFQPPPLQRNLRPGLNPNLQAPPDYGSATGQPGLPGGFSSEPRMNPGMPSLRTNRLPPRPQTNQGPALYEDETVGDELFDEAPSRGPRRAATDYQQAYREAESGYDEEVSRSRVPWILIGLLFLALAAAGAGVWYYTKSIKPLMTQTTGEQQVPLVEAPATAAKVQPDQQATPASPAAPTKKQIYDRIVGDREVLGGNVVPTEEVPLAPVEGATTVPDPAQPVGQSGQTPAVDPAGDSTAPLPIPPPPGDGNTQGSLDEDPSKQSSEVITPAAGESQAAVVDSTPGPTPTAEVVPDAPPALAKSELKVATAEAGPEVLSDATDTTTPETSGLPSPKLRKIVVEPKVKKLSPKKEAEKQLGAKPVVLVAPSAKAKVDAKNAKKVASLENGDTPVGGLYDADTTVTQTPIAPQVATPVPAKKKTLVDLFNGTTASDDGAVADVTKVKPAPAPAKLVSPKPVPAPAPQLASKGVFAAQLASFRTKAEASTEFGRLKSKYGSIFSGISPIISEAQVAGSTRFRLSAGGLGSRAEADAFCRKLFAAGERDCLIRKQ